MHSALVSTNLVFNLVFNAVATSKNNATHQLLKFNSRSSDQAQAYFQGVLNAFALVSAKLLFNAIPTAEHALICPDLATSHNCSN